MTAKPVILMSCLAAAALIVSPAMSAPRHGSGVAPGSHGMASGTAHVTANHFRYDGSWRSGHDWRHDRHHGGTSFVFYGGYPYYGYYPYWYPYLNSYPYAYYYYGRPEYAYDDDSLVAEVQRRLGDQGYYRGTVDGIVGPRTRSAIRGYERTHGLRVDGEIDRQLLAGLGLR